MKMIPSLWTYETGRWSDDTNSYANISRRLEVKEVGLDIVKRKHSDAEVLRFNGGPTGFESYYLDDMLRMVNELTDTFCICAGTTNSWPICEVKVADVRKFLEEEGKL